MNETVYAAYLKALAEVIEAEQDFQRNLSYYESGEDEGYDYYEQIMAAQQRSNEAYKRVRAARLLLY